MNIAHTTVIAFALINSQIIAGIFNIFRILALNYASSYVLFKLENLS